MRVSFLAVLLAAACRGAVSDPPPTPESDPDDMTDPANANCGADLACGPDEFCLGFVPEGAELDEQEYSCQPLPEGCEDFDEFCYADPPCVTDWATEICGEPLLSYGCTTLNGQDVASCQAGGEG